MTILNVIALLTILFTLIGFAFVSTYKTNMSNLAFWTALLLYANIFYKLPLFILATYQNTGVLVKNAFVRDIGITLFSIVLVYFGYSYKGLVIASCAFHVGMAFFLYKLVIKNLPYLFTINLAYLKSFLKISLPLLPVFFFSWIIQSSDSYFLVWYRGEDVVGKYSVIYGLTNIVLVLTYALNFFWFPISARLWMEDREKYRKAFIKIFTAFSTLLLMVVILFELNSKSIMMFLVRKSEYHDAYIIIGIITFSFAMQVLITLLTAPLYSNKNTRIIFFSYLSGGLINAVLNFLLIPSTGIVGAAISTAVSYLTVVISMSYFNYKAAGFAFLDRRLFYITGIFIIAWIGAFYLREHLGVYQCLMVNIPFLLVMVSLLYFIVLKDNEKEYLLTLYKEFKLKKAIAWEK